MPSFTPAYPEDSNVVQLTERDIQEQSEKLDESMRSLNDTVEKAAAIRELLEQEVQRQGRLIEKIFEIADQSCHQGSFAVAMGRILEITRAA